MSTIYSFQLQVLQEFHTKGSRRLNSSFDKTIQFAGGGRIFFVENESACLLGNELGCRKTEIAGGGTFVSASHQQHPERQPVPPNNPI